MTFEPAKNEKPILVPLGGEDVSRPLPLAGAVVEAESAMAALA